MTLLQLLLPVNLTMMLIGSELFKLPFNSMVGVLVIVSMLVFLVLMKLIGLLISNVLTLEV